MKRTTEILTAVLVTLGATLWPSLAQADSVTELHVPTGLTVNYDAAVDLFQVGSFGKINVILSPAYLADVTYTDVEYLISATVLEGGEATGGTFTLTQTVGETTTTLLSADLASFSFAADGSTFDFSWTPATGTFVDTGFFGTLLHTTVTSGGFVPVDSFDPTFAASFTTNNLGSNVLGPIPTAAAASCGLVLFGLMAFAGRRTRQARS